MFTLLRHKRPPATLLLWMVLSLVPVASASAVCGDTVVDAGEQCDDGNTDAGDCCSATCQYEAISSACDIDACSTGGTCNATGTCQGSTPVICDDSAFCNGLESCDPVLGCQNGTPPVIDDGVACTDDSCDEVGDVVVNAPNDGLCDNGAFCDGSETCHATLDCQAGTPPAIDDGVVCTDDSCDEVGDVVVNTPNDGLCDNGAFCDGSETCNATLDCQAGTPPAIDDGVVCTDDSCDEVGDVVVNAPNDGLCDNGAFCDGSETCNATLDCQAGTPPVIDDGIACTDDSCDEVGDVVVNAPNDGLCDNGAFCDGSETCHATLDCQAGTPPAIDDGVACTDDSCDEVGDVVVNAPNNGFCSDGTFCNGAETCDPLLGCQAGTPPAIDDGIACTDDSCDEVGDVVVNLPNNAHCDDALFCNGAETCDPLLDCQAGAAPTNDDGVVCTDEVCDEVGDVVNNVANDANCDDTLLCNGLETCDPVLDCQASTQPGTGALFEGDIVMADPRIANPSLNPTVIRVDPVSGAQSLLSVGGMMTEPRDVAVEANRCVLVPDDSNKALIRIDPLTYDPLNPADNQQVVSQFGNFDSPRGITIAPNGDIYVSDVGPDDFIHKIDPITGAQTIVSQGGFLSSPRRVTLGPDGMLYTTIFQGVNKPAVARIDPTAYDPFDLFANQEIVASGGFFNTNNGPWDLDFDENGLLIVVNAQVWNLIRVDVNAYNPLDLFANQEIVADAGTFSEIRGLAVEADGHVIVPDEGNQTVVRVDPDSYNPLDQGANQTILASGLPMVEPRGAWIVGEGTCGNGVLDAGEQCDDDNELDGDCCSSLCQYEAISSACDIDACSTGGTCNATGTCQGSTPVICDDSAFCNGLESCDPVLGCQNGTPPVIDDGVACTDDSCDEVGDVVVNTVNNANCDDALFCNGAETCDPLLDCQAGTPPAIDDGVACTDDSCDEVGDVVVNAPNNGFCSDGTFCNGAETCDPLLGCQAGTPPAIDDGIACTDDSCDEVGDVVVNLPNNAHCDDALFCNGAETCDPLLDCQAGAAPTNDDGVVCTDEVCDEVGDVVNNVANDANCDDTLLCNGLETCDPVLDCQASTQPGTGALFEGDIVMADPRIANPSLNPTVIRVDPVSGAQSLLSVGGMMTEPRDVAVEANRCVLVPDDSNKALIRIDPLTYDPLNPADNQQVVSQFGNFDSPRGITIAPNGDIYVSDVGPDDFIHKIDPITGAQTIVSQGGFLSSPRRVTLGPDGMLYTTIFQGVNKPAVARIDPTAYDPFDLFANQEIVASGGFFNTNNGPWDLDFDENGLLIVVNAQVWNLIRVDVNAYNPLDLFANQEIVADAGTFSEIRGLAVEADGHVIVPDEGNQTVVRVDPDSYNPLDQGANQTILASGLPMVEPRGAWIVGEGTCGNGVLDAGEQCDDDNELDGDCCSSLCQYEAISSACDIDACSTGGTCNATGTCQGSTPVICDDSAFCNGLESCDPVLGCQNGTPPVIDDGVACTDDSCDEVGDMVVNAPNDGLCDNGAFCDGSETCNATLDCQAGTPPAIDDGVACTDDSCDEVGDVVVNTPNNGNCDNGLFCDGSETCHATLDCQAGTPPPTSDGVACTDDSCDEVGDVIVHIPNNGNCDNGAFCDGSETCDLLLDCQAGTPPAIDDGVACTDDSCDEVGDVVVNAPNDGLCDNGAFCDGSETCHATLDCQAGTPPAIDDGVVCTDDSCDEVGDVVVNTPNDGLCDNGAFCDGSETCNATLDCQAGTPPPISDGVVCTDDSCDEVGDVVVNTPNDANCDNGAFCDGSETCNATLDCQAGTPPPISDGVVCTDDSCDEVGDVIVNTPNDANCDNALFCDGDETCHATLDCQAGTAPDADDGIACTDDSCDEVGDVIVNTPNDANCDNGLFCDGDETCSATLDCEAGTPPEIDDLVACTDDSCDEVGDQVVHVPNAAFCDDAEECTTDGCDLVTGCFNDPIPMCNAEVDTLPPSGRLWLIVLLALGAAAALSRRELSGAR